MESFSCWRIPVAASTTICCPVLTVCVLVPNMSLSRASERPQRMINTLTTSTSKLLIVSATRGSSAPRNSSRTLLQTFPRLQRKRRWLLKAKDVQHNSMACPSRREPLIVREIGCHGHCSGLSQYHQFFTFFG